MTRLVSLALAAALACPAGSSYWRDPWGNAVCQTTDGRHDTVIVQPGPAGVPRGYTRSLDPYGTPIARDPDGGSYYGPTGR